MIKIKQLIVHCSASKWADAEVIRKWHVEDNGWRDIGYHYVILNGYRRSGKYNEPDNGLIESGRPIDNNIYIEEEEKGAHAKGFNDDSVGICLIGDTEFTEKQFISLAKVINYWKAMIPELEIIGHCDLPNTSKTCPNFNVQAFVDVMSIRTGNYIDGLGLMSELYNNIQ